MPPRATDEQLDDDLRRTQSNAASGRGAPGKATRSSKLPSRSGEPKAAPAAASAPEGPADAVEDPFWFADGESEGDTDDAEVVGPLAAFAPAFGDAVRGVTLHLGSPRARSTGVEALADGDAVHVADGGLDLESPEGRALVGHELAHVMQQRDGRVTADRTRDGGPVARDPGLEDEAEAVGARVARGEAAGIATPEGSVATPIAQYRVGAGLLAGDPVTISATDAAGTVVAAEGKWGYRVRFHDDENDEDRTELFTLDKLDLVADHDYGGRGTEAVADRNVPGTKKNLDDARKPRRKPAASKRAASSKEPAAKSARNVGSDARDALRSMDPADFDALFSDLPPIDALQLLAADSQESELDDDGEARPNNLKRLRGLADRFVVVKVEGAAHVVAGTATFRPRHAKQVLPHQRRSGWPGGADDASLEVEIYAYGARTYAATMGSIAGRLVMTDGGSEATFTPASGDPVVGTLSGFSADVPGRVQLLRRAAPVMAVSDDESPSPSPSPSASSAPIEITLTAVVSDTLHTRDEDGRFYTLGRVGDVATLTLGSEQARASGKPGGGFATTRTDLAPTESYVWYGPKPKDGVGEFGGRLSADRWRGALADAADRQVVFDPDLSAEELMDGDDDIDAFERTNTPVGSRVAYFKRQGRQPLRWFGPPREGERIGLRKPDYGGPFTEERPRETVEEQMDELGERLARFGEVAVPKTISLWRVHRAVQAPLLPRDPRDPYQKPGPEDRKKMKDRKAHWRDGAWLPPSDAGDEWSPPGWESRPPASKERDTMMEGAGASDEARRVGADANGVDGLGVDLAHPRQEWCHLIGHGDGGSEDPSNLAAGSHYANTEQLALEEGARSLRAVGARHGVVVLLKVTTYLVPGTNCADAIRYRVALWRRPKPGAKGKSKPADKAMDTTKDLPAAAAMDTSKDEPAEIFDHLFDGQSESFDRNEFAIAKQTLIEAGARQFAAWDLEVDLDAELEAPDGWGDGEDFGDGDQDVGRFTAGGRGLISWDTQADGNCGFNGFAQALLRLVREGRLTAAQVAAPLAVQAATITDLLPSIDDNPAAIEDALKAPLRTLAIDRLVATPARVRQLGEVYVQELNRRVAVALRRPVDVDAAHLFRENSNVDRLLDDEAQVAAATIASQLAADAADDAVDDAILAWVNANTAANAARFADAGLAGYAEDMRRNGEYVGGPELGVLAGVYGVQLTVLRGLGGGEVMPVRGDANCGLAQLDGYWGAVQLTAARSVDLFEGIPVGDRIAFTRKTDAEVDAIAAGPTPPALIEAHPGDAPAAAAAFAALIARYRVLRAATYRHAVEIGMYRHAGFNHWSAVTNQHGNANLDDVQDRLPADAEIPDMVDEEGAHARGGDEDAALAAALAAVDDEFELDTSGSSDKRKPSGDQTGRGGDGGKRGTARFVQRPGRAGGTDLSFAQHMFERSSASARSHGKFAMNRVDPRFARGQRAAVVNAANPSLHGGAGIALALQEAVGAKATAEWTAQGKKKALPTGDAAAGVSGDLAAQGVAGVIHAVAPMGSNPRWRELLRQVCERILAVAASGNIDVLVMCSLGTGIYGLPPDEAAQLMVDTFTATLAKAPPSGQRWPSRVVFNNFPGAPPSLVSDVRGMGPAAKDVAPKASASMSDTH